MTDPELDALITQMRAKMPADPRERGVSFLQAGMRLLEQGDLLQAMGMFRQVVAEVEELPRSDGRDRALALAWYSTGFIHGKYEQIDEEIALYDRVAALFGDSRDSEVRYTVALALFGKAFIFTQRGTLEDAARAHAEVVDRFVNATEPQIRECVAAALFNSGLARGHLGHPEEELRDYDRLIALFGSDSHPALRRQVALALSNKIATMCRLGRQDEVLLATDELNRRFGDDPDPRIQAAIAKSEENRRRFADALMTAEACQVRLGELIELGDCEAVSTLADSILFRCSDPEHASLGELVSRALFAPAQVLARAGRLDEATRTLGDVIDRVGGRRAPAMERVLATAVMDLAVRLGGQRLLRETIDLADRLLVRNPDVADAEIAAAVAAVLDEKAASLCRLGQPEAALDTCADALRRFPAPGEPRLRLSVVSVLCWKAFLLRELRRTEEAIAVYSEVPARFGDDPQPGVRRLTIIAMLQKLGILEGEQRLPEVVATCDELIERFGDAPEQDIRMDVAKAAFSKIDILARLGEPGKAIAAYDAALARFGDIADRDVRDKVAGARSTRVSMLFQLGRMHEAVQNCDDIIMDSEYAADPALLPMVAIALRSKGIILEQLAWPEAASDVYAELVARFGMDDQAQILEQVTLARERLAVLRTRKR